MKQEEFLPLVKIKYDWGKLEIVKRRVVPRGGGKRGKIRPSTEDFSGSLLCTILKLWRHVIMYLSNPVE